MVHGPTGWSSVLGLGGAHIFHGDLSGRRLLRLPVQLRQSANQQQALRFPTRKEVCDENPQNSSRFLDQDYPSSKLTFANDAHPTDTRRISTRQYSSWVCAPAVLLFPQFVLWPENSMAPPSGMPDWAMFLLLLVPASGRTANGSPGQSGKQTTSERQPSPAMTIGNTRLQRGVETGGFYLARGWAGWRRISSSTRNTSSRDSSHWAAIKLSGAGAQPPSPLSTSFLDVLCSCWLTGFVHRSHAQQWTGHQLLVRPLLSHPAVVCPFSSQSRAKRLDLRGMFGIY